MSESLSHYSNYYVGIAQQIHPDSSSDEGSSSNLSSSEFQFEERHASFVELNNKMPSQTSSTYFALKDTFSTLVKLIDGEQEAVKEWNKKFQNGIAETTKKISGDECDSDMESSSSSLTSVYVTTYRGQSGLIKEKKEVIEN
eukprot:10317733-Ditylum_brightwellii.AAC.1